MNDLMQMYRQLMQNPVQFLMQRNFNIPSDINVKDPNAIIQHLLNSGQVSQMQVNQAMQMRNKFIK